jgi:segregation and condensation protein B
MTDRFQHLRLLEAVLFASAEPLAPMELARHLPEDADLGALLEELAGLYANRGVNLVCRGERWAFRTAPDLAPKMQLETSVTRKLSRAAVETLAIIAYHQPVTRGEIEEVRGVALSRGTLDTLLEAGWVRPKGRRRTPGRPVTWGTTPGFLDHFGLESLDALPGLGELKAAGLLDPRPAIAALGAKGLLPGPEQAEEEEDGPEEDVEELLASDFGEDMVPGDDTPEAAAAESGGRPVTAFGGPEEH